MKNLVLLSSIAVLARDVTAMYNGLAVTPQMGWDNWNSFGCDVSEDLLLNTARKIVSYGLRDAGYTYVILDDCWSSGRSPGANGSLIANSTRFPNGMADVADRIHDLGLRFGMYSSAGSMTCARYTGSLGYEEVDAQTFADWGVDYLKYDNCYNEGQSGTPLITYNRYKKMQVALNNTGRPILYSLCNWGEDYPWKWAQTISNSWRTSGDITDFFDRHDPRCPCPPSNGINCALPGFHCSAMNILGKAAPYIDKGIPGSWNDLDMLEVGNGGMTDAEYVAHFTMWALVKSPLVMGNDFAKLGGRDLSILINPAVIAVSQDPMGAGAFRRWIYDVEDRDGMAEAGTIQMWSGALSGGDFVVALLNAGTRPRMMNATLADIFVDSGAEHSELAQQSWDLYDLWGNRMPEEIAAGIIGGNVTLGAGAANVTDYYYNATAKSYAEGLASNDMLLMGTAAGSVQPMGVVEAMVEGHGVRVFRMRMRSRLLRRRDEL
ncbi:glycoside hydrolase family 27 protein [Aulographum hederae CBS 113979]|uniref:Alpha-galactosidase n=1 Tax=Aulographum hederae CBS 113979 TaxID=1176131 RepID=A0A6G1GSR0_9PEZI|nr:glycoside hydrolase family 27 protein [Aulographum hederae CBS 113979]